MGRRAVSSLDDALQIDNILNFQKIDLLFDGSRPLLKVGPEPTQIRIAQRGYISLNWCPLHERPYVMAEAHGHHVVLR